jgi:hypothetical protein
MQKIVNGELVDMTPEEIAALTPTLEQVLESRQVSAKAECRRRILDLVDETAQINLAAAAAADKLTAGQLATYDAGLDWIMSLRATWPTLAADTDADIYDDANWPQPTQAMRDLAAAF